MAFIYGGHIHGGNIEPRISYEAAVSLTTVAGALVTKTVAGASIAAKGSYDTAEPVMGILQKTLTASDTVAEVINTGCGSILIADVDEILNGTVITAASGSATTFVATALIGLGTNDALNGAQFTVKTKAADSSQVGKVLTITGYTTASGTLTFATTTSVFAAGDTLTLTNLGIPSTKVWYGNTSSLATSAFNRSFVSNPYLVGLNTLSLNSTSDALKIQVANNPGGQYKVIGTTADGTKLVVVLIQGWDSIRFLATK